MTSHTAQSAPVRADLIGSLKRPAELLDEVHRMLGVVSTRHPRPETADEIVATVDRAACHIPLEQLATSPQCGVSSALTTGEDGRPDGNNIEEETQ